jgi:diguanylate cyclase (GGDEF)-like protein
MKKKLFILFLLAALVPMVATSAFLCLQFEINIHTMIDQNAQHATRMLNNFLENQVARIMDIARKNAENHDLLAALEQDNHLLFDFRLMPIYNTLSRQLKILGFEFYDAAGNLYSQAQQIGIRGINRREDPFIGPALQGKEIQGLMIEPGRLVIRAACPVVVQEKIIGACHLKVQMTTAIFQEIKKILLRDITIYSEGAPLLSTLAKSAPLQAIPYSSVVAELRRQGQVKECSPGLVRIYSPLFDIHQELIAVVALYDDISSLTQTRKDIRHVLIGIFLAAIVFSTFISLLMSQRITHPVVFVSRRLVEIASGNMASLDQQIEIVAQDELADLVRAYNQIQRLTHENTKELQAANEKLRTLAETDGLTGAYNRRFFNEYYDLELKRSFNHLRYKPGQIRQLGFGIAILDIDDFKRINDTHGHLIGDLVLQQLVQRIREIIFSKDILCRYGGEEFVIIFTQTDSAGTIRAACKVHTHIVTNRFYFDEEHPAERVTVSIGVASFDEIMSDNANDVLNLADNRLYRAKRTGKNKVFYDNPGPRTQAIMVPPGFARMGG